MAKLVTKAGSPGIVSVASWVMLRGAFGTFMQIGYRFPSSREKQRVWLLRFALLCVLGWIWLVPQPVWAARAVPMCSFFAECAEAPPPEAPPTGGEVRANRRGLLDAGPSLDRAPNNDSVPLHWSPNTLESLSLTDVERLLVWVDVDPEPAFTAASAAACAGVALEVFRPPCTKH